MNSAVIPLTVESFAAFGFYADMLHANGEKLGAPPVEFFRDMVQQDLGQHNRVSYSTCRCAPRDPVVCILECHSRTAEVMLPLDNDMLLHVAPATAGGCPPELDKLRVFRVPQGTLVVLRPGTWHHGPFALNDRPVNILIALPERTYANDCTTHVIPESNPVKREVAP